VIVKVSMVYTITEGHCIASYRHHLSGQSYLALTYSLRQTDDRYSEVGDGSEADLSGSASATVPQSTENRCGCAVWLLHQPA
jgi:hypothetical protein